MQGISSPLAPTLFILILAGWTANGLAEDSLPKAEVPAATKKGILTLRQAAEKALVNSPELKAYSLEIRAREARTLQAGLWSNPKLNFQVEDLGRKNANSGTPSQSTVTLSQKIELGGKPDSRRRTASLSRDLAGWDFQTSRANILNRVARAFVDVLGAKERLALTNEMMENARAVEKAVVERVRVGKVSPIDQTKARIALAETRMELENAKRAFDGARIQLSSQWGQLQPDFETVSGDLYKIPPIPPLRSLLDRTPENPDLARWSADIAHRRARIDEEKANAVPNVTISGGYRRIDETDDNTVVLGFTVPLNFFNRNQGSIKSAMNRLAKGENKRRAEKIRVESKLAQVYQTLTQSGRELEILEKEILPGAQSAYNAVNEGYRFGKFSLLNVLDSQRTLFRTRARRIAALVSFHQAAADMERLTGWPLRPAKQNFEESAREGKP